MKKDNLTDVVQQLPKQPAAQPPQQPDSPKPDQQVVNGNGETITLGI